MAGHPRAHSFVSTHRKEDRVLLLASRYYAFVHSRSLFFLLFLLVWRHTHVCFFIFFYKDLLTTLLRTVCCVLLLLVESPPEKKRAKKEHKKRGFDLKKKKRNLVG